MFSLLFDATFWYMLLAVAGAVIVTILCAKYSVARIIVGVVALLSLFASSVYSCVYLNKYYSASGGIYGQIEKIFRNEVDVEETAGEYSFNLENIVLTETSNANEYFAEFYEDKIIKIDAGLKYSLFINNIPVSNVSFGAGYINGTFIYNFYDLSGEFINQGEMNIGIGCYSKATRVYISIVSEKMEYWYSFFDKNDIVLEIKTFNYEEPKEITINGSSDTSTLSWGFNHTDKMLNGYYSSEDSVFPVLTLGWTEDYVDPCTLQSYENSWSATEYVGGFVGVRNYEEEISYEIVDNTTIKVINISNHYDYFDTKIFKLNYFDGVGVYTLTDIESGVTYIHNAFSNSVQVV